MPIRVLLVEDSPVDARLIRERLGEAGAGRFALTHVDRLASALEKLASEPSEVVVLDLSLPDSRGIATFQRLHAASPGVPVVVLTGLLDEELACRAVADGASDYLLKQDVSSGLLTRALRYAIERQRSIEAMRALNMSLEQRVHERTAQLEAANEEIEAFAYSISHDLRAPLRIIAGYCQILAEEHAEALSAEAKHYLDATRNQAARMKQLISDLLDFSRLSRQPLRKSRVDPADVAREVLQELTSGANGRDVAAEIAEMPA